MVYEKERFQFMAISMKKGNIWPGGHLNDMHGFNDIEHLATGQVSCETRILGGEHIHTADWQFCGAAVDRHCPRLEISWAIASWMHEVRMLGLWLSPVTVVFSSCLRCQGHTKCSWPDLPKQTDCNSLTNNFQMCRNVRNVSLSDITDQSKCLC